MSPPAGEVEPGNGGTIAWRLATAERRLNAHAETLDELQGVQTRHDEQMNGDWGIVKAVNDMRAEFAAMKRAGWGVAAALVVAAITFAVTGHG